MKLFNFFKKKEVAPEPAKEVFPESALLEWPSIPNEKNKVPALEDIIAQNTSSSKSANLVKEWCEAEKKDDDYLEYQVVMESQYGLFTIPAMIRRGESGGFLAFYSHAGNWDDQAFEKLLDWTIKLRGCDFVHTLKIIVCVPEGQSVPNRVKEITSRRREHRMMISQIPHLRKDDPIINSRIFAEAYGFFCNENKILNFDEYSLAQVEDWYKNEVRGCAKDSFLYSLYVYYIGAYFGRVICDSFKVSWQDVEGGKIIVVPASKLKPRKNGMAPGDMKINILQITVDFVCNPRLENSLITNLNLIKAEIIKSA